MTIQEAIRARHSVRQYENKQIPADIVSAIQKKIDEYNHDGGLHIQLVTNEPEAFQASAPHYGKFQNCQNYLALVAKPENDEKCGYYGEQLVLLAQTLGLNTCWVALTYKKKKAAYICNSGEKLRIVIALGYGKTQGVTRKSKALEDVCKVHGVMPDWFKKGMEAVLLAPTAVNQQKFMFTLDKNKVTAKALASIFGNTKFDLGIAKCHFEIGAGKENFIWG